MLILPAIDLRGGRCVRLFQGKADQETVYAGSPVEVALNWKAAGARMLHIADLDGAFQGAPVNLDRAVEMKKATGLPVEMGGGFRDLSSIERAIEKGINRVILGSVAVSSPELVQAATKRFGAAIAVSIDVAGDFVAVAGWKTISTMRYETLMARMIDAGVRQLLFTDTSKDGTLTGPNIPGIRKFLAASSVPVIACGGMSKVEDVTALLPLKAEGLSGIVIGKALYDQKINLKAAIAAAGPQA